MKEKGIVPGICSHRPDIIDKAHELNLGAGRDKPESGFRNAFEAGGTFIAVGMFDFQVKENAELVNKILRN